MSQNIFHPGSRARTISLNTQYMVLFKNPRDRQQIKTLARQMYPDNWLKFMERFNRATNKPYGKLIIDLRPNVLEKNRFLGDENNKEDEMRKKSLTQMYSEKVKQQRDRLQFKRPYAVRAMDIRSKMDMLMKDTSLPDNLKSNRYNELLREYQFAMSKNEDDSTKEIMQHIIPLKDTVTADTTTTTTHESTESMPSTSATPKSSKHTPSFAVRQLTPPQSLLGADVTPLINFSDGERVETKHEASSATPVSPSSSDDVYLPEAYPSPSNNDLRKDEGDPRHGKSFISLSDDEGTKFHKRRRSEYKFRRRVANRDDPVLLSTKSQHKKGESSSRVHDHDSKPRQSKYNKGESSSGYFIDDIQPHKIPLPPDSSDDDYDPDIYPKGTSLDIRRDEGDKDHIKSFVSYSDDEAEKEKKEKRSEYKFRKRVAKKRKSGKKPY